MNGHEFSEDPAVRDWSEAFRHKPVFIESTGVPLGEAIAFDPATLNPSADLDCRVAECRWGDSKSPECECSPGDPISMPSHYTQLPVECIDVTEHFGFCLGNAIKYIWRADHKGKPLEDLRKARWYIDREIARREREQ